MKKTRKQLNKENRQKFQASQLNEKAMGSIKGGTSESTDYVVIEETVNG